MDHSYKTAQGKKHNGDKTARRQKSTGKRQNHYKTAKRCTVQRCLKSGYGRTKGCAVLAYLVLMIVFSLLCKQYFWN